MTERIRSKLITKIPVVITGVECAQYEEVALSLIRKMTNFKEDFCATINDPHEWKDLEEDFVNVVVVKDPFGLEMLDESKTKEMDKIFHSIASRIQNSFSTVILTKKSVLEKAIKFVPHKENKVYSNGNRFEPAGTECYPIDMEAPIQGTNKRVQPSSQVLKNMLDNSSLYLRSKENKDFQQDNDVLTGLETNGSLVITGDEPEVLSSYVASLATRDEGKHALVLKRTADLRYVERLILSLSTNLLPTWRLTKTNRLQRKDMAIESP
ncbi:uncharacterized protein LOC128242383 [Mya arenaria]|uniref:uncharacterized protein LOC128242383 n=1 Tax=Mya arenaria TaxID=6604 RepID=UPI0022E47267|nr:uncharacterized protein LOC128242383 [Mya arenaria]XP_052815477.1 uncharacterized protein LOC128242383 [Mya arenaria]